MDNPQHEFEERRDRALAMGGPARLDRRRASGVLNARERLALLFDAGRFDEVGLFATAERPEDRHRTPADGKVVGFGEIEGRRAGAVSNDMTVLGASSSTVNARKIAYAKDVALKNGLPLVFLGESSGGRIQDNMGARGMGASSWDPQQYVRTRETPWASAVLGPCFGSSAWYTCMADYAVMRKGAVLAVASSKVTSQAIGQFVDAEELGGWEMHAEVTGLVDQFVDTDEEAIAAIREFLSYMPSHAGEAPPRRSGKAPATDPRTLEDIVPLDRAKVYSMYKVIDAIVDAGSFFDLKRRFAPSLITGLARLDGQTVGIMANNPAKKGGAVDYDACDKAISFLVLCDSFHIPVIQLVDQPGFLVGVQGERRGMPAKIMSNIQALQMCTVPKLSVVLRKSYGAAYVNMGGGRNSDDFSVWNRAEVSFMDPGIAVAIAHGVDRGTDPEKFAELRTKVEADNSPYEIAGMFAAQSVITPAMTRDHLVSALAVHTRARTNGLGRRRLADWPYR
ncbi:carboxyl transferase domain-containing protein [Oricola sp.]|uniref:acyl-CoA carboxylase subunit beta n=1 Tax=Oricola sp. TaxID=1979950 RepID=UPI0025CCD778|nr:carboxyl transferase domain-containing protein [Oricola sp.]MCI5075486.1 methylmalonyl-CoA carboxyltransferase [Oricola sp.]